MQHTLPKKIRGVNTISWLRNRLEELDKKNLSWREISAIKYKIETELHWFLISVPHRYFDQPWKEYKKVLSNWLKLFIRNAENPCFYIMESCRTGKVFIWPLLRSGMFSFKDGGTKKKMQSKDTVIFKNLKKAGRFRLKKGGFVYRIQTKGELF